MRILIGDICYIMYRLFSIYELLAIIIANSPPYIDYPLTKPK